MNLFEILRLDFRTFNLVHPQKGMLKYFYYPDARTVLIFRLSQWFYQFKLLRPLSYFCTVLNDLIAGVWIGPRVQVGGGLVLAHARGLVVNPTAIIGKNCLILQRVTIGGPDVVIGDNVALYANATVVSNHRGRAALHIGNNVIIGAGSVVVGDIPDCSIVAGVPGKVVKVIQKEDDWVGFEMKSQGRRGGPENSDSPLSGSLAQPEPWRPRQIKEQAHEKDEKESRPGIQGQGGLGRDTWRQDVGRAG